MTRSLNFTAGTLLWPIVFILTDVVNEYYGRRGVRFISWLAVGLILYGFAFAFAASSSKSGRTSPSASATPSMRTRSTRRRCARRWHGTRSRFWPGA